MIGLIEHQRAGRAGPSAAEDERTVGLLGALAPFGDIAEFRVVLEDVVVGGRGLAELALALEVERQAVNQVEHRVIHRQGAELVQRHVELALVLEGEPEHAVGLAGVGLDAQFLALGHEEALGGEQHMAEQQQQCGRNRFHPHLLTQQQVMTAAEQRDQQHKRYQSGGRRRHARQQQHEVERERQVEYGLGTHGPIRTRVEVLVENAGDDMRREYRCLHALADRRDLPVADARRGRANQHDLVRELRRRDAAGTHVAERVGGERRAAIGAPVEACQHAQVVFGANVQVAELHAFTEVDGDVGRFQVETAGREQQRQRGVVVTVVLHGQGVTAHGAVGVGDEIEVADTGRVLTERGERQARGPGLARCLDVLAARHNARQMIALHKIRQRRIRFSNRPPEGEVHGEQHVAGSRDGLGQAPVGVELLLGLVEQRGDFTFLRRLAERGAQTADVAKPGVGLWFTQENLQADDLGLGGAQFVDHLGQHAAWPGPATDLLDALVVDGDDGDVLGRAWIAVRRLNTGVIGNALKPFEKSRAVEYADQKQE